MLFFFLRRWRAPCVRPGARELPIHLDDDDAARADRPQDSPRAASLGSGVDGGLDEPHPNTAPRVEGSRSGIHSSAPLCSKAARASRTRCVAALPTVEDAG